MKFSDYKILFTFILINGILFIILLFFMAMVTFYTSSASHEFDKTYILTTAAFIFFTAHLISNITLLKHFKIFTLQNLYILSILLCILWIFIRLIF